MGVLWPWELQARVSWPLAHDFQVGPNGPNDGRYQLWATYTSQPTKATLSTSTCISMPGKQDGAVSTALTSWSWRLHSSPLPASSTLPCFLSLGPSYLRAQLSICCTCNTLCFPDQLHLCYPQRVPLRKATWQTLRVTFQYPFLPLTPQKPNFVWGDIIPGRTLTVPVLQSQSHHPGPARKV